MENKQQSVDDYLALFRPEQEVRFPNALATVIGEHEPNERKIYLVFSPCTGELEKTSIGVGMGYKEDFLLQENWGITIDKAQALIIANALTRWANQL